MVTKVPLGVLLLILSLAPVLFIDWTSTYAARPDLDADQNKDAATTSSVPLFPVLETDFPPPTYTKVIKVGKKDTLTSILRREGISLITVSQIQKKLKNIFDPRSIKPGQEIVLQITPLSSRIKHKRTPPFNHTDTITEPETFKNASNPLIWTKVVTDLISKSNMQLYRAGWGDKPKIH